MSENRKLISLKEASIFLSMHHDTLRKKVIANEYLGVFKIGGRYKVDISTFKLNFSDTKNITLRVPFERLRHYFETESAWWLGVTYSVKQNAKHTLSLASAFFYEKEFTRENIELWKNELKIQGKADGTIRKYVGALSVMVQECIKVGLVKENPCEGATIGLKVKQRKVFLTPIEREKVLSVCNQDLADQINFAIETGLRQAEQFNLTWDRVLGREILIVDTKNGEDRVVPLSPPAFRILESRKYLKKPFDRYIARDYNEVIKKSGIGKHVNWHDLRRTFGMWCIKGWHSWIKGQNYNKDVIGKFLGHLDIRTTAIYASLDSDDLHNLIEQELYEE